MRYIATVTSVLCWLVSIICMRKMRKLMAANCEILVLCVLFNSRHTSRCLSLIWVLYACMIGRFSIWVLYVCNDLNSEHRQLPAISPLFKGRNVTKTNSYALFQYFLFCPKSSNDTFSTSSTAVLSCVISFPDTDQAFGNIILASLP